MRLGQLGRDPFVKCSDCLVIAHRFKDITIVGSDDFVIVPALREVPFVSIKRTLEVTLGSIKIIALHEDKGEVTVGLGSFQVMVPKDLDAGVECHHVHRPSLFIVLCLEVKGANVVTECRGLLVVFTELFVRYTEFLNALSQPVSHVLEIS